jgi:DNA-binding LacI/PurR family transcriptional regulator
MSPVLDGINGSVMDRYLHAVTEALEERGYHPVLVTASGQQEELAALIPLYETGLIDAAMLAYTTPHDNRPEELRRIGMPFVSFGRPWGEEDAPHPWVDIDNATGVEEGTRLLRERGHTRIGYIGPSDSSVIDSHRRDGWVRGMAGLDVDLEELDMCVPEGSQNGFAAMRVLRDRGVTAAACGTDSLALGALSVLYESPVEGYSPAESVVGFDDSPVASALGFSSVVQPVEQVASLLVAQLIGELEDSVEQGERRVLLPSVLRPRLGRNLPVRLG